MDEVHRQVLQKSLTYLQKNLSPACVLDKLFQAGILSDEELLRLHKEPPTKCVRELVVSILPRAGSTAFPDFIKALQANQSTTYISEHLLAQVQEVQQSSREGNSTHTVVRLGSQQFSLIIG